MTGLILVLIISSLLLAMTGSLTPAEAAILVIGSGVAMFAINFRRHQDHHRMILRSHEIGATSASRVRHLGGLPFPIPTPVNLFLTQDYIRFETDHDLWQCSRSQIDTIVIMTAEQIHSLPDREILKALSGGSSRLLSLVREKIRRGYASVRHARLLFLKIKSPDQDDSDADILILSYTNPRELNKLIQREDLLDRVYDFIPDVTATKPS
ncbi:MAG: hypothetical protein EOM08_00635 [Clostridia bacterium]|nr:hypothetical protein [Clostridia bacterium]NCC74921.1 hypothetical protein [Clostridia bacterium]